MHLQLELSWQEEYKILQVRTKQIFCTVTEVYRPQKRRRVGAERRHRPRRAGRKTVSLPQKFKRSKASSGDLKSLAERGAKNKHIK